MRDGTTASSSERVFLLVFTWFELISWTRVLFMVEYILSFWSCVEQPDSKGRWRWATGGLALLDLLVVVVYTADVGRKLPSLWLGGDLTDAPGAGSGGFKRPFSALRVLRLFSHLRVERHCKSFTHFTTSV